MARFAQLTSLQVLIPAVTSLLLALVVYRIVSRLGSAYASSTPQAPRRQRRGWIVPAIFSFVALAGSLGYWRSDAAPELSATPLFGSKSDSAETTSLTPSPQSETAVSGEGSIAAPIPQPAPELPSSPALKRQSPAEPAATPPATGLPRDPAEVAADSAKVLETEVGDALQLASVTAHGRVE